jgi:thiol-disulfide isomerase/thioredoxin
MVTDTAGRQISLNDPAFAGKPVVLQVMGTWCPNCMDETQFLTAWYKQPDRKDVQVLGLAFERKPEPAYWRRRLGRVVAYHKVPYAVGYAGLANKDSASKVLPFAGGVKAFPTTIFLNRKHQVVAVHTGFAGPATGAPFAEFKAQFNELIVNILK